MYIALKIGRRRAAILLFEARRWEATNHLTTRGIWTLWRKMLFAGVR